MNQTRQTLDGIVVTIRVHLHSLNAVTLPDAADSTANIRAKVQMLEWGLDCLTQSIDNVLRIAGETSKRLTSEFDAEERGK